MIITIYSGHASHASSSSEALRLGQHQSDMVNGSVGSDLAMQAQLKPREAGAAAQVQCSQRGRLLLQAAQHGQLRGLSACGLPIGQAQ